MPEIPIAHLARNSFARALTSLRRNQSIPIGLQLYRPRGSLGSTYSSCRIWLLHICTYNSECDGWGLYGTSVLHPD